MLTYQGTKISVILGVQNFDKYIADTTVFQMHYFDFDISSIYSYEYVTGSLYYYNHDRKMKI